MRTLLPAAAVLWLAAGCTGSIHDGVNGSGDNTGTAGRGNGGQNGTAGGTAAAGSGNGTPAPGTFVPAPSRLRRLTAYEYRNSVQDLLGPNAQIPIELEPDTAYNGSSSLAAARVSLSAVITEQFETAAHALAEQLVKDSAQRQTVVGCVPSGAADEACLRSFVTTFGRRVFRRPLSAEEVETYVGLGKTATQALNDFWGGVQYTLAGLLQSPNFLYRSELGAVAPATPGRRVLDGYELASRLSYLLWASTPDLALLDAAQAGTLATPDGLRREAERLLAAPRAEDAILRIFSERLRLDALDELPQSPERFPLLTPTLGASMRGETLALFRDLVFRRNADFREVFTTTETFLNADLARLYGVSGPAGAEFVKTPLPAEGARGGLLTHASFLALNSHETMTSPTYRGKFIVESFLCRQIPAAPNDVDTEFDPASLELTARQRLLEHQARPDCVSCHTVMDPPGLALEHFDAIGAYRADDRGMAIDATGSIDGVAFDGARQLGDVIAKTPDAAKCAVRSLYRVATAQMEHTDPSDPVITSLAAAFESEGFRFRQLVLKLVENDGFRFVGDPE